MPEEKQVSQEQENVEQASTDGATDALVTAAQEAQKKEETAEQREQKERSNLGRKVKKLEETLEQMNEALQELSRSRHESYRPTQQTTDELPEYVSTPDDVERILTLRERKQKEERDKYQSTYAKTFRSVGRDDSDYEEVLQEMYENFNVVRTGNAEVDAELNYAKAKASILAKKMAPVKAKPNVKGEKATVSTNLSVESRSDEAPAADIQLDDFAKEFVSKVGMKTDSVKDAMKGESPIHLRK